MQFQQYNTIPKNISFLKLILKQEKFTRTVMDIVKGIDVQSKPYILSFLRFVVRQARHAKGVPTSRLNWSPCVI